MYDQMPMHPMAMEALMGQAGGPPASRPPAGKGNPIPEWVKLLTPPAGQPMPAPLPVPGTGPIPNDPASMLEWIRFLQSLPSQPGVPPMLPMGGGMSMMGPEMMPGPAVRSEADLLPLLLQGLPLPR